MTRLDDIRAVSRGDYWSTFGRRWSTLLTYRYLGRTNPVLDCGANVITMPLRHDMRNERGGVMAAPLCIAAAESGGMHDDTHVPNPVTASLQILDAAHGVKRIQVIPETLRLGRSMGFSRSLIVDADVPERVIALSSGSAISRGRPPEGYERVENPPLPVENSPSMPRLHEVFDIRRICAGVWEIAALDEPNASPDAALHLGPQHIALEAAAAELAGQGAQARSWQMMFLARGQIGPFRTRATLHGDSGAWVGVRVDLTDAGNADRLISTASASFER